MYGHGPILDKTFLRLNASNTYGMNYNTENIKSKNLKNYYIYLMV